MQRERGGGGGAREYGCMPYATGSIPRYVHLIPFSHRMRLGLNQFDAIASLNVLRFFSRYSRVHTKHAVGSNPVAAFYTAYSYAPPFRPARLVCRYFSCHESHMTLIT